HLQCPVQPLQHGDSSFLSTIEATEEGHAHTRQFTIAFGQAKSPPRVQQGNPGAKACRIHCSTCPKHALSPKMEGRVDPKKEVRGARVTRAPHIHGPWISTPLVPKQR